jgi:uncharacterized protein YaiE (UPF0345 family)
MKPFKKVHVEFDYAKLRKDVCDISNQIKQSAIGTDAESMSVRNICLTVPTPDSHDWSDGSAGKSYINNTQTRYDLKTQFDSNSNEMIDEHVYIHPINQIKNTYLEQFIKSFKDVYRWRISMLPPRTTLSIHKDGSPMMSTFNSTGAILDWRLHFPITTNNRCFLVNWPEQFNTPDEQGETVPLEMAHFKAGSSYLLNTSMTHCATNYSNVERIHLIASLGSESTKNFSV